MIKIDELLAYNKNWAKEKLKQDGNFFNEIAKEQRPTILYIGCSDSRVSAEEIMGIRPGDAFVHRNIANLVVGIDLNVMSVVNYAVKILQVDNIIICGHYGCGGIKAALEAKDLGILNPWLRNIRDVYRLHKKELNLIENVNDRYRRLVELNVQEQCVNVIKTAAVQKAYRQRNLKVYGMVFDMSSGLLKDLEINFTKILNEIMEIYRLED